MDSEYATCIVEFINRIIRCSIIPKDKANTSQSNIPSVFF